jgi:glycine hydroxymethyltransferase
MLVNVNAIGLSGRKAERVLDDVGISANRNTIPGETRPPTQASGIRLGTPAITTRGFKEDDCRTVARLVVETLSAPDDEASLSRIRDEVRHLTDRFPVPGIPTSL